MKPAVILPPTTAWLLLPFTMAAAQCFRAMELIPAPTLSPRSYQAASPVIRARAPLNKRQFATCSGGQHPCGEIGTLGTGFCCPDNTYCIVDPLTSSQPACCAIGSVCGSSCSEDQYQCVGTSTITSLSLPTTTTVPACCPRQCTATSMFGCPSSLGGGCCSYGQTCASNSQCLWTSTTSTRATLVSQFPAGCTTSQLACPSSLGGGCCAVTQSCTFAGTGPACVDVRATPSGLTPITQFNSNGLTTATKAGIAIGIILFACILSGCIAYLCLRRRRKTLASHIPAFTPGGQRSHLGGQLSPTEEPFPSPFLSPPLGTTPTSLIRRPRRTGLGALLFSASPATDNNTNREINHPDMASFSPGGVGRLRGLTADYFGPAAVPGPFTVPSDNTVPTSAGGGGRGTEQHHHQAPGGINPDRAVPMSPQSPDDITAPVEIDSRGTGRVATAQVPVEIDLRKREAAETIEGRCEMDGGVGTGMRSEMAATSPYTPSPLTAGGGVGGTYDGSGTWESTMERGTVPPYEAEWEVPREEMSYVPGPDTIEYSPIKKEKEEEG